MADTELYQSGFSLEDMLRADRYRGMRQMERYQRMEMFDRATGDYCEAYKLEQSLREKFRGWEHRSFPSKAWIAVGKALKGFGLEKYWQYCGGYILDERMGYQLIAPHGSIMPGRYLRMVNPSTGEIHIEGVPPGTCTVGGALQFRNGTDRLPIVLT